MDGSKIVGVLRDDKLMEISFLNNAWWSWFWSEYSMTVIAVPTVVAFVLKLIAIYHPGIKSDQIIDVFKTYWPVKKDAPP